MDILVLQSAIITKQVVLEDSEEKSCVPVILL
jgi:hypothetical protein